MTDGQRNEFEDGAVPAEYGVVFLAKWLGIGPWEVAEHPDWYEAIEVCATAWRQAEAGPKVSKRN